ncbi:MAG TPA: nucleotidyltransferase domain-containing protein [Chitinophagaceae bacterium]|nr:nucleotidyltransferase domain-containing protein [Chitinophagaceae bacterium]
MFTRDTVITTVKKFIEDCEEKNIQFSSVILFGSSLTGTVHEFSDIDVLLASPQFTFDKWENAKLIATVNKKYKFIEAHTFPRDYYLKGDPFINEVIEKGYRIK